MPNQNAPIGVYDSGMGGFAVVQQMLKQLPGETIEYVGDTLHLPYGPRPQSEVRSFVLSIGDFFVALGVKAIVIACNTATAAGLEALQAEYPNIPCLGMINPGTEAALQVSRNKRIGIVATRGTVKSGNYDRALKELDQEVKVFSQPCPELLRIAEEGGTEDTEYLFDLARRSISPVLEEGIDTLVLGCTDFTCIREAVDAAVPDQVQIVDPAVQVTERLEEALRQKGWLASSDEPTSSHRFWVTGEGEEQFMSFGEEFLGIPIPEVHTAKIDWRGE